ncbi:MAG: transcriptional repressor LexA [Christensenellales bacterium]
MESLTKRQFEVLEYIKGYIDGNGYAPCVRDICFALDLKSTSTAHAHLTKLERKGYISRDPAKPRTIMICGENRHKEKMVAVPVLGKVAAGMPITAVENIEEYISLPYSLLCSEDVFMLNVSGDSMMNAGIRDKDKIIAQKQNYAQNGDIVVALLEDEATVKRFFLEEDRVRLQPENENFQPIYTRNIDILGKVIGVLRMFK